MDFDVSPGFCSNCGTILPMVPNSNLIKCFVCKTEFGPEAFGTMESSYVIHFNKRDAYADNSRKKKKGIDDSAEGPVVERKCPKCGNDKMSYATLQLRSADEGQTVFFTCTNCKFKETENS